jgi:hypothetical protein
MPEEAMNRLFGSFLMMLNPFALKNSVSDMFDISVSVRNAKFICFSFI